MHSNVAHRILIASALSLTACGGAPPPVEAPPAPVAKPAEKPAPVDLSAVPEPRALALSVRIARPRETVGSLAEWMGTTAPSGALFAEAITDVDVGEVVDLSHPIDFALTFEGTARPDVGWAVSAALVPGESTLAKLRERYTVTAGHGGVMKLEVPKDSDAETDRRCAIFPAYGAASLRIVCSDSERGLRDLGPYLVRTRPRAPIGKDVEVEGRAAPMREFLTQGRQMLPAFGSAMLGGRRGIPGIGPLIKEALGDMIDLGLDLDRVSMDASLTGGDVEGNLRIQLTGSASTFGRFLTAGAEKAGPPPEAFGKIPANADTAFFGRGWDARDMEKPKTMLFQLARTLLDKEGVAPADAEALERVASAYFDLGTNGWVSATGSDWGQAAQAVKKLNEAKRAGKADAVAEAERLALEKLEGWALWGVEQPLAKVSAGVKEAVTTFNRPALQKALKSVMPEGVPAPTVKLVPVSAAYKLPKDSVHVEVTIPRTIGETPSPQAAASRGDKPKAAPKAKPKLGRPVKLQLYVVPDGGRTWLAWGLDDAQVAVSVRSAATGDGVTLAKRRGLERLFEGKSNSGGFASARRFARSAAGFAALFEPAGNLRTPDESKLTQDWGTLPMFFGVRNEVSGNTRSMAMSMRLPREVISELVSLDGAFRRSRRGR